MSAANQNMPALWLSVAHRSVQTPPSFAATPLENSLSWVPARLSLRTSPTTPWLSEFPPNRSAGCVSAEFALKFPLAKAFVPAAELFIHSLTTSLQRFPGSRPRPHHPTRESTRRRPATTKFRVLHRFLVDPDPAPRCRAPYRDGELFDNSRKRTPLPCFCPRPA